MTFANYGAFRLAFLRLADGDDISQATFSTETADLMIGLGEDRVYRDLRASCMVMPLSIVPAGGVYALPDDLIELKEIYFSGEAPLEIVPLDRLRRYVAAGASSGDTIYAAQHGDVLQFWPEQSTATVLGSYYAKPLALKDETDWADAKTLHRYPECFLWASLAAAAGFLGRDEREGKWDAFYQRAVAQAQADEQMRIYGAGRLRVRAS